MSVRWESQSGVVGRVLDDALGDSGSNPPLLPCDFETVTCPHPNLPHRIVTKKIKWNRMVISPTFLFINEVKINNT